MLIEGMKRKNKEGRENDLRKEEIQLKNISVNFASYTYIYIYIYIFFLALFMVVCGVPPSPGGFLVSPKGQQVGYH